MQKTGKIILGIDPGTQVMGYGIIAVQGNTITLTELGVLKPGKIKDNYKRLQLIFNTVSGLITKYRPDCFAIEAPFFGKNVQSMLKLGRAQGVAIAAAMRHNLEVAEYSPKKVKQSVTGNGNAAKEQVWKMLQTIVQVNDKEIKYFDASDALAVAVCHHFQDKPALKTNGKLKDWKDFIAKNPARVKANKG